MAMKLRATNDQNQESENLGIQALRHRFRSLVSSTSRLIPKASGFEGMIIDKLAQKLPLAVDALTPEQVIQAAAMILEIANDIDDICDRYELDVVLTVST